MHVGDLVMHGALRASLGKSSVLVCVQWRESRHAWAWQRCFRKRAGLIERLSVSFSRAHDRLINLTVHFGTKRRPFKFRDS
jgi:hypothetical protein